MHRAEPNCAGSTRATKLFIPSNQFVDEPPSAPEEAKIGSAAITRTRCRFLEDVRLPIWDLIGARRRSAQRIKS